MAEVDDMLTAGPISASALSERLDMVRMIYWTETMSTDARKAWLLTWLKALARIPAIFVRASFDEWFATGTRRPTPGDIGNRAREIQAHARVRRDNLAGQSRALGDHASSDTLVTEEDLERYRKIAREVGGTVGSVFAEKRIPKAVDAATGEDLDR